MLSPYCQRCGIQSFIIFITEPKIVIATTAQHSLVVFGSPKYLISYAQRTLGIRLALVEVEFDKMAGQRIVDVKKLIQKISDIYHHSHHHYQHYQHRNHNLVILLLSSHRLPLAVWHCQDFKRDFPICSG